MRPLPLLTLLALALSLAGCAVAPSLESAASVPGMSATPAPAGTQTPAVPAATDTARTRPANAVVPSGPLQPITAAEATSTNVALLEAPPDLWDRIRRGFAMPALEGDLVRQHEQWYSSRPEYIQRMTERSRKYLFHIV
jgi:membrane-bound lytic murein transglycosylase D